MVMVTVLFLGLFCKFFFQKIHLAFWYYLIYLAAVFSQTCSWWLFLFFYILRNKICLCGGTGKPSWYLLLQMWHHVFYKQRKQRTKYCISISALFFQLLLTETYIVRVFLQDLDSNVMNTRSSSSNDML